MGVGSRERKVSTPAHGFLRTLLGDCTSPAGAPGGPLINTMRNNGYYLDLEMKKVEEIVVI